MSDGDQDPRTVYWNSLEEGRLRFQRCSACANRWLPPRTECPRCWSAEWVFEEASGHGRVVSWVVFHTAFHEAFKERVPYNVAIVELAEGPRMPTRLVDVAPDAVEIGMPLEVVFDDVDDDLTLYRFRPKETTA